MARRWSIIQIGNPAADHGLISTREFRENLEWAIVVPGEGEMSAAVGQLLDELLGIAALWSAVEDFRVGMGEK